MLSYSRQVREHTKHTPSCTRTVRTHTHTHQSHLWGALNTAAVKAQTSEVSTFNKKTILSSAHAPLPYKLYTLDRKACVYTKERNCK